MRKQENTGEEEFAKQRERRTMTEWLRVIETEGQSFKERMLRSLSVVEKSRRRRTDSTH